MNSICIAIHNGERFLAEQMESILCEIASDDEVIISDDGSSDHSIEVVKSYADYRVNVVRNIKVPNGSNHIKTAANFENALRYCKGDIIFLSDQDDRWIPGKYNAMVELLSDYIAVISDCRVINEYGSIVGRHYLGHDIKRQPNLFKDLVQNPFHGCCMAFRRQILNEALPFPDGIPAHDLWIGIIAELMGEVAFLEDEWVDYRIHGRNVAASKDYRNPLIYKIAYRVYILYCAYKRLVVSKRRSI